MNTFDRIIQKDPLNGGPRARDSHDGKLIVIDAKSETILPGKPFITLRRELRYWQVQAEVDGEGSLPALTIKDFTTDQSLQVSVSYRARCPEGYESRVALALGLGEDASRKWHTLLETLTQVVMRDLRQENRDPVGDFFNVKKQWQNRISQRAGEQTGLDVEVRLEIEGEKQLGTLKLANQSAQVRVKDYAEPLALLYTVELDVDSDNRSLAVLSLGKRKELEQGIAEEIRQTALDCTLHELCFSLDGAPLPNGAKSIAQVVRERVERRAAEFGRKVVSFFLQHAQLNWLPQQRYEIRYPVSCEIDKFPQPITVQHTLVLKLKDVGLFMKRRMGDVKDFFQARLEEITRSVLLRVTYVELLLKFQRYSDEIERQIKEVAKNVGLDVDQLISLPALREIEWREKGFEINVGEGEKFETKVPAVKVNVAVVGRARLRDLEAEKVKPRIDRSVDIPEEVRNVVRTTTSGVLHRTEPERFYLEFSASKDGDQEAGVESLIQREVRKALEPYALDDLELTIKQGTDPLKERYDKLVVGTHMFTVDTLSYRESAAPEMVVCEIEFKICAVDSNGWSAFIGNQYSSVEAEIGAIKSTFQRDVKDKLNTMPIEKLRWTDYRTRSEIEYNAIVPSLDKIRETYGLVLRVVNFGRKITASAGKRLHKVRLMGDIRDTTDVKIVQEQENRRLVALSKMEDQLLKLRTEDPGNIEEIELLEEQISGMQSEHTSRAITPHEKAFDPAPKDASPEFSYTDFAPLSGQGAQPQLPGGATTAPPTKEAGPVHADPEPAERVEIIPPDEK